MAKDTELEQENREDLLAIEERAAEPVMTYSVLLDELQALNKITAE